MLKNQKKRIKAPFLLRTTSVFSFFLSFWFQIMRNVALSEWNESWYLSASLVALTFSLVALIVSLFPSLFDVGLFSLSGFAILFYVLMLLFPAPWIYADFPDLARDTYLKVVVVSLLLTILGMCIFHIFFDDSKITSSKVWLLKEILPFKKFDNFYVLSLLMFSLTLLLAYVATVGVLPIVKVFQETSSAHELAIAREDAFKLLDSPLKSPLSFLRNLIFPMVSSVLCIKAMQSQKYVWFSIFVVALIGNIFLASATLEKSPVTMLTIQMALLWLIFNHKKINIFLSLVTIALSLSFPLFVLMASSGFDGDYSLAYNNIFNRVFYGPSHVLIAYVDYFSHYDFLEGRTIPFISKYFLGGNIWIENIIGLKYFDYFIDSVNANVGYPGYLWADFGWTGIILGSLICGLTIPFTQYILLVLPKSPFVVALYLVTIRQCFYLPSTAFPLYVLWFIWGILLISPSLLLAQKYKST